SPSVTRAMTRSPGSACRTKRTWPSSVRAMQWPPWATGPTSTSYSSPTSDFLGSACMAGGLLRWVVSGDGGRPPEGGQPSSLRPVGRAPARRGRPPPGHGGKPALLLGGGLLLLRLGHRATADRTRSVPLRALAGAQLGGLGGVQLPGHRGDHDAGGEEEAALEAQGGLVVEQMLVPVADDVLRDVDGDGVARALAAQRLDVVD